MAVTELAKSIGSSIGDGIMQAGDGIVEGWTSKQFSEGDRVSVVKKGTQTGSEGTVVDPNWDGRVKISMDNHGVIKSYLPNELRLCGFVIGDRVKILKAGEHKLPQHRTILHQEVGTVVEAKCFDTAGEVCAKVDLNGSINTYKHIDLMKTATSRYLKNKALHAVIEPSNFSKKGHNFLTSASLRKAMAAHVTLGGRLEWYQMEDRLVKAAIARIARWYRRQLRRETGTIFRVQKLLVTEACDRIKKNREGMRSLLHYLVFSITFFGIVILQRPVSEVFSVERGLANLMAGVKTDDAVGYSDVQSVDDVYAWVDAMVDGIYDGPSEFRGSDSSQCYSQCTANTDNEDQSVVSKTGWAEGKCFFV
jgi:hypothetical protein